MPDEPDPMMDPVEPEFDDILAKPPAGVVPDDDEMEIGEDDDADFSDEAE